MPSKRSSPVRPFDRDVVSARMRHQQNVRRDAAVLNMTVQEFGGLYIPGQMRIAKYG